MQCLSVTLRKCYSVYGTFKLTYIFAVDQNKPPVQNINIFGGQVVIGDDGAIHQEGIYHRIFWIIYTLFRLLQCAKYDYIGHNEQYLLLISSFDKRAQIAQSPWHDQTKDGYHCL